jgi:hypothetical protein
VIPEEEQSSMERIAYRAGKAGALLLAVTLLAVVVKIVVEVWVWIL